MRRAIRVLLVLALPLATACGSIPPMTVSEFKGFCYQYSPGGHGMDCVAIPYCDQYVPVLEKEQPSQAACIAECNAINLAQNRRQGIDDCMGAPDNSRDWCERFCRTNYKQ